MARTDIDRLFDSGMISEREYKRTRKSKGMRSELAHDYARTNGSRGPSGAIGSDAINAREQQGKAPSFGPSDESVGCDAIDKKENRREFPKESALKGKPQNVVPVGRSANTKGWPSEAQVRRISANEWKSDWY